MKLMKTNMEFVKFDAEDVITTSGGFSTVSYITGMTNYPGLAGYNGDNTNKILISSNGDSNYIVNINNDASLAQGLSWLYQGVAQTETVDSISSLPGFEKAELKPIDINTFENYNALIEWLNKSTNGLLGQ